MPKRLLHLRPWRRHSLVLAVAGVVYVCYGIVLVLTESASRTASLVVAIEIMPLDAWGVVWMIVGVLTFLSTRWPPQSETWGYAAMSGMAAFWSACVALGILILDASPVGLTISLVWAMVAFLWWAISGLINPEDLHKPVAFDWTIGSPHAEATE